VGEPRGVSEMAQGVLSEDEVAEFRALFDSIDVDGGGEIDAEALPEPDLCPWMPQPVWSCFVFPVAKVGVA